MTKETVEVVPRTQEGSDEVIQPEQLVEVVRMDCDR